MGNPTVKELDILIDFPNLIALCAFFQIRLHDAVDAEVQIGGSVCEITAIGREILSVYLPAFSECGGSLPGRNLHRIECRITDTFHDTLVDPIPNGTSDQPRMCIESLDVLFQIPHAVAHGMCVFVDHVWPRIVRCGDDLDVPHRIVAAAHVRIPVLGDAATQNIGADGGITEMVVRETGRINPLGSLMHGNHVHAIAGFVAE